MVLGLGKCPEMSLTVILGRGTVTVMGEPTMRRSLTPNLNSGGPGIFNHIKVTQGSWAGSGSKKKSVIHLPLPEVKRQPGPTSVGSECFSCHGRMIKSPHQATSTQLMKPMLSLH